MVVTYADVARYNSSKYIYVYIILMMPLSVHESCFYYHLYRQNNTVSFAEYDCTDFWDARMTFQQNVHVSVHAIDMSVWIYDL